MCHPPDQLDSILRRAIHPLAYLQDIGGEAASLFNGVHRHMSHADDGVGPAPQMASVETRRTTSRLG
jgi:hypothetical protein